MSEIPSFVASTRAWASVGGSLQRPDAALCRACGRHNWEDSRLETGASKEKEREMGRKEKWEGISWPYARDGGTLPAVHRKRVVASEKKNSIETRGEQTDSRARRGSSTEKRGEGSRQDRK